MKLLSTCLFLSFISLHLVSSQKVCPDLAVSEGCVTGSCKDTKVHPNLKWNIPTGVPLLQGYNTGAFYLVGDIEDDTEVANRSTILVSQRRNFTNCCRKCKNTKSKKRPCKYFQFLNLGSYGGLCFVYTSSKPRCNESMLVKSRAGAKCQNSTIENDPHLTGADGTRFDFSGSPGKSYCLISDRELHVNMHMTGYLDNRTESATKFVDGKAVRTWIRELGLTWKVDKWESHSLKIVTRKDKRVERGEGFLSFMEYNEEEILPRMNVGDIITRKDGQLTVTFKEIEKTGPYDVEFYHVVIGDLLDMDIRVRVAHPLLRTIDDAEAHISMGFNYIKNTPSIHGVLGQTYRPGREARSVEFQKLTAMLHRHVGADSEEGKGFLDGKSEDYEVSHVMSPDCKYSAYQGWASDLALFA